MSKKQKTQSSVKPSSPLKIVLPVLIGLLVVLVATIVIAIVSTPKTSAKVENPNGTFVTIGDYEVTNQKMYEVLRSQYGVNKVATIYNNYMVVFLRFCAIDIVYINANVIKSKIASQPKVSGITSVLSTQGTPGPSSSS